MNKLSKLRNDKGQVFIEYVMVIGVIAVIMAAMGTMIKRSTQGMIKATADQIGFQANADQSFDDSGFLESSYTTTRANTNKRKRDVWGWTSFSYDDTIRINSNALINAGFTRDN